MVIAHGNNFSSHIATGFSSYGLTSVQATGFATLNTNWINSWNICQNPSTRIGPAIETKNLNKRLMVANLRLLARIIQSYPGTTDAMRRDLGLTVRGAQPTPRPPVTFVPSVTILSAVGRVIKARAFNPAEESSRRMPAGIKAVTAYTFVGENPPENGEGYQYQGTSQRTTFDIELAATIPNGSTVWVCCTWVNSLGGPSLGSEPVSTVMPGNAGRMAA